MSAVVNKIGFLTDTESHLHYAIPKVHDDTIFILKKVSCNVS